MTKNQSQGRIIFAILSITFVTKLLEVVSPAIQSIGAALDVPYTSLMLIMTIPVLVSMPVSLLIGFVTGKVVKYRTAICFALILMAVGGMAPFWLRDWTLILVARGVFGFGQGIIMPVVLALIFNLVKQDKQATIMGMNNTVSGIAGMIFTAVSGILAVMSWNYPFLLNAVTIVTLVFVIIFLPEPEKHAMPAGMPKADAAKKSGALPAKLWAYVIMMFVFSVLNFPSMGNISIVLNELGMNASMAGFALMLMTGGTMVSGLIFGKFFKGMGTKTIPLGFAFSCVAQILLATGMNFPMFAIAEFLVGFGGLGLAFSGLCMASGNLVTPDKSAMVMSLTMTGMNVGLFISPFVFNAIMMAAGITSMRFPYWVALVGFAVLAIAALFVKQETPPELDPILVEEVKAEAMQAEL